MIDKSIPIYVIYVKNDISKFYLKNTLSRLMMYGYRNVTAIVGWTPEHMGGKSCDLVFNKNRIYGDGSKRDWVPEELAIWESHYTLWKKCIELNTAIVVMEHDCYMYRPLEKFIENYDIYSFTSTSDNKSIPAVGYYLTPHAARKLIARAKIKMIDSPVDGVIHQIQLKRMPHHFNKEFMDKYIFAYHHIDKDVGTTKPTIGKKKDV